MSMKCDEIEDDVVLARQVEDYKLYDGEEVEGDNTWAAQVVALCFHDYFRLSDVNTTGHIFYDFCYNYCVWYMGYNLYQSQRSVGP
jgi:hypothetical protein